MASVVVTPDTATVLARSMLQLQATLLNSAGRSLTGRGVHWTSSDPFVATVSSTGLVTGVGHGPAIITATAEQSSGAARLTVFAPVASVTVDQGDQTIVVGGAVQLSATPRDWRGVALAARVVAWSSSDPGTVSVTPAGVVTGHAPGSGVLTATSEGQTGSATIAVAILELSELAPGLSTHTCGVTPGGATFCWGSDAYGQLGNGAAGDDATAVRTRGDHRFVTVSGGGRFTCGLVAGGAAYCWGSGARGRLGNGSVAGSPTPVAVAGGLSFRTLSAGFSHACALTDEGAAYCWGDNGTGQLGTETVKLGLTPIRVAGDVSFAAITVGDGFTCALAAQGTAYCWGNNQTGQLGSGGSLLSARPLLVQGARPFSELKSGARHSCGVTAGGAAYCWGDNRSGELGDGSTRPSSTPVPVAGGLAFSTISAGSDFTCGVTTDGRAYCWGEDNGGRLGTPAALESCDGRPCSTVPLAVSGELRFASVAAGDTHSCGLATAGIAYCWGQNSNGQLGDGTTTDRPAPVRVLGQPYTGAMAPPRPPRTPSATGPPRDCVPRCPP